MNKDNKNKAMALSDNGLEQAAGGFSIDTFERISGQKVFKLKNDKGETLGTYNSVIEAKAAGADTGEAYNKNKDTYTQQKLNNEFFNITNV